MGESSATPARRRNVRLTGGLHGRAARAVDALARALRSEDASPVHLDELASGAALEVKGLVCCAENGLDVMRGLLLAVPPAELHTLAAAWRTFARERRKRERLEGEAEDSKGGAAR